MYYTNVVQFKCFCTYLQIELGTKNFFQQLNFSFVSMMAFIGDGSGVGVVVIVVVIGVVIDVVIGVVAISCAVKISI